MDREWTKTRSIEYRVPRCPECRESHIFTLEIHYATKVALFGGEPPSSWDVILTCPIKKTTYTRHVSIKPNVDETISEVAVASETPDPQAAVRASPDLMEVELQEWVKASAPTAHDFSKTMITTATGAIPLFFAVLKYLGAEKAVTPLSAWLGVVPPALFIASAVAFVIALRPQYELVDAATFERFRTSRLKLMNKLILLGTGAFLLGVLLAIVVFLITLYS
jgi:hypothetical protein